MLLPLLEQLRVTRPAGRPHTRPDAVLGDKAYSSRAIRTHLRTRGIKTVIPEPADQQGHRKRRGSHDGRPVGLDAAAYKGPQRHRAPVRPTQAVARAGNPVRQVLHRLPGCRGAERGDRVVQTIVRHALGVVGYDIGDTLLKAGGEPKGGA